MRDAVRHLLPLLVLAMSTAAAAGDRELIPRREIFRPADRLSIGLTPDGDRVVWIDLAAGRRLMWAPIESPDAAEPVPFAPAGLTAWRWAHRPMTVLVDMIVAGSTRTHRVDIRSGDVIDLTPDAESSRVIAVSPNRPEEVVLRVVRAGGSARLEQIHLDRTHQTLVARDEGMQQWFLDDEYRVRAARRANTREGYDLVRLNAHGEWVVEQSYDWSGARVCGITGVDPAGTTLYYTDNHDRDRAAMFACDLATGSKRVVAEDALADVLYAGATRDPSTGAPQAVVSYYGRMRRDVLDPSVDLDFEMLSTVIDGDVSFVERSRDDRTWLVRSMDGGPMVYYAWNRDTHRATRLFSDMEALATKTLPSRRSLVVPARDGLPLPCHLYLPPGCDADGDGVPDAPLPTIVYVHGGPWVAYLQNQWFTNRNLILLADRGYAVIRAEFRGGAGYGWDYIDASNLQWGGAMHTDLLDIVSFAAERGITDPKRAGIWGWSYGGYATFAALAFAPDAFACGVSMYGLSDLETFVENLRSPGAKRQWHTRVGDVTTDEGRAHLRAHSPLHAAEHVTAPLFVTHGALDPVAPISHSDRMVEALREHGKDVTYVVYPEEPHDYRLDESWISFWAMAEPFLAEHLGGRAQPDSGDVELGTFEVRE